jgi:hypothetical protein
VLVGFRNWIKQDNSPPRRDFVEATSICDAAVPVRFANDKYDFVHAILKFKHRVNFNVCSTEVYILKELQFSVTNVTFKGGLAYYLWNKKIRNSKTGAILQSFSWKVENYQLVLFRGLLNPVFTLTICLPRILFNIVLIYASTCIKLFFPFTSLNTIVIYILFSTSPFDHMSSQSILLNLTDVIT